MKKEKTHIWDMITIALVGTVAQVLLIIGFLYLIGIRIEVII